MKIERKISSITTNLQKPGKAKKAGQTRKAGRTVFPLEIARLSDKAEKALNTLKNRFQKKSPDLKPLPEKNWTVLLYLDGDNNLEPDITKNLLDLEQIGSTPDINFVAQLDRGKAPAKTIMVPQKGTPVKRYKKIEGIKDPHGGLPEANRYYVTKSSNSQCISSPAVEKLGRTDSGSAQTLKEFLIWGFEKYPAKNYLVILGNHGGGFRGGWSDDGFGSKITLPEMNTAILGAEKAAGVDKDNVILGFDACLMAQTEVGYGLKDTARSMLASEETENDGGWAYSTIFGKKKEVGQYNQEQMENKIIDSVKWNTRNLSTFSVTDLSQMDNLKDAVNDLAKAMMNSREPKALLRKTIMSAQNYGQYLQNRKFLQNFRDIYDVAEKFAQSKEIKDPKLKKAARGVMAVTKQAVKAETHSLSALLREDDAKPGHPMMNGNFRGSHGLTINANYQKSLERDYAQSAFAKDTRWFDALKQLRVSVKVPDNPDLGEYAKFSYPPTPAPPKNQLNQAALPDF